MIKNFWNWFAENEWHIRQAIYVQDKTPGNILESLFVYLEAFCPPLTCMMQSGSNSKKYEITISPRGNPDAIMLAATLAQAAPAIPNWKIKAFVGPQSNYEHLISTPYPLFGINIIPNTINFYVYDADWERERYDLILLLPLPLKVWDDTTLFHYFYSLLVDLWGEIYVTRRINNLLFTFRAEQEFCFIDFEAIGSLDYFKG